MVDDGLFTFRVFTTFVSETVIFLPRPCLLTVAVTEAPSTVGAPTLTESPPTNNTFIKSE